MIHHEHAIVIPGLLRCVDHVFLDFLDSASQFAEIFVVTEKSCTAIAAELSNRYDATIVFDTEWCSDLDLDYSFFSGSLGQFLKLEIALDVLSNWEAENNHEFRYVHRFRSDVLYSSTFEDYVSPLLSHGFPSDCLLNQFDFNFSGRRSDIAKFRGICSYVQKFRSDKTFFLAQLSLLNSSDLKRSVEMGPFPSAFPVGVAESEAHIESFHANITEKFSNYIDAAASFARALPSMDDLDRHLALLFAGSALSRTYSTRYSPQNPEHIYAKFVNSVNLAVHPYSGPWLPLRFARYATTPFTKQAFDGLQAKDFTCLKPLNHSMWKAEVNSFLDAGGRKEDILKVLTGVKLTELDEEQCKGLYTLIDILDFASWIIRWRPWFVDATRKRGLGLPSSLQSELS